MAFTMTVSSCRFFATQKSQEVLVAGRYSATTDFSRDILTMNGTKKTIVYKNGRQETLRFKSDHRFQKTVRFSSDRVANKKLSGQWHLIGYHLIMVEGMLPKRYARGPKGKVHFTEYYQYQSGNRQLIRLDQEKKQLAAQYAPFYTFYRQESLASGK